MAQDPLNPIAPQGESSSPVPQKPADSGVDLSKILLPKKEVHAPENAERVNAGALLESEQSATLVPPQPPVPAPPAPPAPKKDEPVVRPINTFQSDIERLVEKQNTSVVSIAAAEASRRSERSSAMLEQNTSDSTSWLTRSLLIVSGIILLTIALAVVLYVLRPAPSVVVTTGGSAPIIAVDHTQVFEVPAASLQHSIGMAALNQARKEVSLSLGLIDRIYLVHPATSSNAQPRAFTAQDTLALLGPNAPASLARALAPTEYLLGVHSFEDNQAFLVFSVTSYEQAFSGMLAWERFMQQDLSPLFVRTPSPALVTDSAATASSTATSSTPLPPQVLSTAFKDKIVENHDARVIQNAEGDVLLLWTFLDRNTLVITTNEITLREIMSRLLSSPIVPLP